jgi:hypothetical protein
LNSLRERLRGIRSPRAVSLDFFAPFRHHSSYEILVAAVSMMGQSHLMAIYYCTHAKMSEHCHPIVKGFAGVPVPFIWSEMKLSNKGV